METVTVKQIHSAFDSASEKLYRKAAKNVSINFNRIEKSSRLEKLGFTKSSECVEFPGKEDIPVYYRKKYPFLKFITREQLEEICEKYGLIYSEVFNYTGEIPEKNLREIESAQPLDKEDEFDGDFILVEKENELMDYRNSMMSNSIISSFLKMSILDKYNNKIRRYTEKLFIAANKEFFDLKNMKNVKGTHEYVCAPKDPIVFRWCRGGILIISKWGDEANDAELVVPELN
jgi:hypothetical protein